MMTLGISMLGGPRPLFQNELWLIKPFSKQSNAKLWPRWYPQWNNPGPTFDRERGCNSNAFCMRDTVVCKPVARNTPQSCLEQTWANWANQPIDTPLRAGLSCHLIHQSPHVQTVIQPVIQPVESNADIHCFASPLAGCQGVACVATGSSKAGHHDLLGPRRTVDDRPWL